jgi:peptide methionine sulfoxide reductase msrA/msrB
MSLYLDKTSSLTPLHRSIIVDKKTEHPHTGKYTTVVNKGTYLCRRCGVALFRADSQFSSSCGWPSFDGELAQAVSQLADRDGQRTEIVCARCTAHLGHVFHGEFYTVNNVRYCVNSASLDFVADDHVVDTEEALVAGGCFWGVEHWMRQVPGVLLVESGYTGGHVVAPVYEQVCQGGTGHYEAVRILFDRARTDYYQVLKRFFEIHDPTQTTGQGPDLGSQYYSAVFCYDEEQTTVANRVIKELTDRSYLVTTRLLPVHPFWVAEAYHQNYYLKHQKAPYCHKPVNRFS